MKIRSSNIGGGVMRKVQDKALNTSTSGSAEAGSTTGTGVTRGPDRQDGIRYTASPEFPARTELVETVRERVASGRYNQTDVIRDTAERIVDSPDMAESTRQGNHDAAFAERIRTGTVSDVRSQAGNGYYDKPEMIVKVAESLMNALGIG